MRDIYKPLLFASGSKITLTQKIHKNIFNLKPAEKLEYSAWAGKLIESVHLFVAFLNTEVKRNEFSDSCAI